MVLPPPQKTWTISVVVTSEEIVDVLAVPELNLSVSPPNVRPLMSNHHMPTAFGSTIVVLLPSVPVRVM